VKDCQPGELASDFGTDGNLSAILCNKKSHFQKKRKINFIKNKDIQDVSEKKKDFKKKEFYSKFVSIKLLKMSFKCGRRCLENCIVFIKINRFTIPEFFVFMNN
jgi:hypothetical protein